MKYSICTERKVLSALHGTYTVTLQELKAVLKVSTLAGQTNLPKTTGQQTKQEDGFQEVRRRKRRATDETTVTLKKAAVHTKRHPKLHIPPPRTATLPVLRSLQTRRQFLAKQVGRIQ
jgi:hypothetical protein